MSWYYLSFVDSARPEGDQFVGGCYVQAPEDAESRAFAVKFISERRAGGEPPGDEEISLACAIQESWRLGINPGGEIQAVGPIPDEAIAENVPIADRGRLLSREEVG